MTPDAPNPAAGGAAGSGRYPQRHADVPGGLHPSATHRQEWLIILMMFHVAHFIQC
jgi:hypothetical protein